MMRINWRVRGNNPIFYAQVVIAILTPLLAYMGLEFADLTSWGTVGNMIQEAYSNPYLLGLVVASFFNAVIDPTVDGFGDSNLALSYKKPKNKKNQ